MKSHIITKTMIGFVLKTQDHISIRFKYYINDAPVTCDAFAALLPFTRTFYHARVSGEEIWINNAPPLDIIQENACLYPAWRSCIWAIKAGKNKNI